MTAGQEGIFSRFEKTIDLEPSLYKLTESEIDFFREQTGVQDSNEIVKHLLKIQADAYKICPYPCIRKMDFARVNISQHPAYDVMRGKDKIFLDIGCCFGTDLRKAISEGFSKENVMGVDISQELWNIGHELFMSSPDTSDIPFICGDVFEDRMLDMKDVSLESSSDALPNLRSLRSLTPLKGRVSFIHIARVFHLFDEEEQRNLAFRLAALLLAEPESMIFGSHMARPVKGFRTEAAAVDAGGMGKNMFCHSPESWKELWDGDIFERGIVRVDAKLIQVNERALPADDNNMKFYRMIWSVVRVR